MRKEITVVPINNFNDLKREFGDIEGLLTYMNSTLQCDIKLKGEKVQLEYPNSYEHFLKVNAETVKDVLKRWKKTYIDKLLRMQYTMSKKYDECLKNDSKAWEKDMESDYLHFMYIESILINDFDYGAHCLYGEGEICPEVAVINCYYCSLHHPEWESVYSREVPEGDLEDE